MKLQSVFCISLWVLLPSLTLGQSSDTWDNLADLRQGQKIQVVKMDLKSAEGRFITYSETTLSIQQKEQKLTLPREEILRVTVQGKSKRLRNTLIGLGIGAGTGYLIGVAATTEKHDDYQTVRGFSTLMGMGAGAGVGAVIPSNPTIYRAQRRK